MNIVSLVGRLTTDPEVVEFGDKQYRTVVSIAVARDYRNSEGIYEADFINVVLWNGVAAATRDYCHKGDVVGVKGKLQSRKYENSAGEKKSIMEVVADKVTFIASVSPSKSTKKA